MDQRPIRMPEVERKIRRSLSITPTLAQAVDELAAEQGHNNFSATVVRFIIDGLNRLKDRRVA
jgi:hypothetical protein